jgi:phosphoglycerate dehydrogenase-like enzyme
MSLRENNDFWPDYAMFPESQSMTIPAATTDTRSLVVFPAIEDERLHKLINAASPMRVFNTDDANEALALIGNADAFFGKITPTLLAQATKLRWIQSPTASLEHYLFPELIEHSCLLTNMRGLFSDVIADHVLGMVLCFARNLHTYLRRQWKSEWAPVGGEAERSTFSMGPAITSTIDRSHQHLSDCTLGVVGAGEIGREILRRAAAFGMTLLAVDPVCRQVPGSLDDVWPTNRLNDLLAASDYVVIAAPHTPETFKLFRSAQVAQMKRTSVLINIGRGAIVDLADLTEALQQGVIAGAGLDVFEVEPLPVGHPLWQMQNVIITPHVAAASPHIAERHLVTLLENVRRFVAGEPLLNVVDKQKWF